MKNKTSASLFDKKYMWIQKTHWTNTKVLVHDHAFVVVLKDALNTGILNDTDLFSTDDAVMKKLSKKYHISFVTGEKLDYKASKGGNIHLLKKFHYIDPEFTLKNKLVKLCTQDKIYKKLDSEKKRILKGYG